MSRYIDADALKNHATHYVRTQPHLHYGDWDNMCISGKEIDEIIDTCPTADVVEVRHGHWVEHTVKPDWLEDDVEVFYNCSECGTSHWSIIPPFCPNCGAKMDGERREE